MTHSLADIARMAKDMERKPKKYHTAIAPFQIPADDIAEIRTKLNVPNNRTRVYREYAGRYGKSWEVIRTAIRRQNI